MRITNAIGYQETRDTIARDWSMYMSSAFPESNWMFIPNIGKQAVDYFQRWKLNALILSGGDDIGVYKERDITEFELLKYVLNNHIPVLGICRGLQLVHMFCGGQLEKGGKEFVQLHRANRHNISIGNQSFEVNSFHNFKIIENSIHKDFTIFARCLADNSVEGLENKNILAMMWHPERDTQVNTWNKSLIDNFLNRNLG